jgi:L-ascorbate metabolism protein UlaG (beta-lactamase superfamily)
MKKKAIAHKRQRVIVTWLGHSAFRFDSPTGQVILVDPWLENPKAPPGARDIQQVDMIFLTHGHGDHLGNTVEIAKRTNARVFAIYEVALYLQKAGLAKVEGINISGSVEVDGVHATMVHAEHSSGLEPGGDILAGGDPAGYVFRFQNGFSIYHAGDTGLFGDMKLIGELYSPNLSILPIGGYFTMGPREAAKACELLKPKFILGMHYGTFPILAGSPDELKKLLPASLKKRVLKLEPGESVKLPLEYSL